MQKTVLAGVGEQEPDRLASARSANSALREVWDSFASKTSSRLSISEESTHLEAESVTHFWLFLRNTRVLIDTVWFIARHNIHTPRVTR